jgi:hypothetical protein
MTLLTKRERKMAECIGASIATKRECDEELKVSDRVNQIMEAVDALIEVLDEEDIAEQLSPWEEDFYQSSK